MFQGSTFSIGVISDVMKSSETLCLLVNSAATPSRESSSAKVITIFVLTVRTNSCSLMSSNEHLFPDVMLHFLTMDSSCLRKGQFSKLSCLNDLIPFVILDIKCSFTSMF